MENETVCPRCGGALTHYNTAKRVIKCKGGEKIWIQINRLRCKKCHSIHRELPQNLLPFKHYDADIIEGVVEGLITPYDLGYEDYPCEMTMERWKKSHEIHQLLRNRSSASERRVDAMKKRTKETRICRDCGGVAAFYDYVSRTVRSGNGKVEKIKVPRFRCESCGHIHRELPDFLMPNKQFKSDIITGFVTGKLDETDLRFEDYPCIQTVRRWIKDAR